MLKVTLLGVNGKDYNLTGSAQTSEVVVPEDSLRGLVASSSRADVSVPGRSGVIPGRRRYGALATQLDFYLHADSGVEMERVHKDFRQALSTSIPASLEVDADHPLGKFYIDLWLDRELPGVSVDMRKRTSARIVADVYNPQGLFRSQSFSDTGTVSVTNPGDGVIYPKLAYSGAGGIVVSPSGATFTLPPAVEHAVIDLDPQKLRLSGAFPEGVEPGDSGTWVVPAGVTVVWEILVGSPWA